MHYILIMLWQAGREWSFKWKLCWFQSFIKCYIFFLLKLFKISRIVSLNVQTCQQIIYSTAYNIQGVIMFFINLGVLLLNVHCLIPNYPCITRKSQTVELYLEYLYLQSISTVSDFYLIVIKGYSPKIGVKI